MGRHRLLDIFANVSVFARNYRKHNLVGFGKLRINIGIVGYRKGFGRIRRIEAIFFGVRVGYIPAGKLVPFVGYRRQS